MKIKICGLTKVEEAAYLNDCRVDYAGMVLFYPKSRRNISIDQAKEIMQALHADIQRVAVVVAPSMFQIRQIEEAGFDCVQIHGDFPAEQMDDIRIPVWKAFNVSDMEKYEEYRGCERIAGYVFDAQEPGSGKTFDWGLAGQVPRDGKLFMLAGGMNAENVCEAVRTVHPDGVDVSSGVEYKDRNGKDPKAVRAFVENVRACM